MSLPQNKPALKLDWCSHEAAKYAVEHWHYSHTMFPNKTVKLGAWEDGKFVGAVVFGVGVTNNIGKPYSLKSTEVCELVRVALTAHSTPVTRILSLAVMFLRKASPGLRLIVSYADPAQGHHGGIYQGANWIYVGATTGGREILINGIWKHRRSVNHKGSSSVIGKTWQRTSGKHKYLMPLDDAMRAQVAPLAKPYPKRICAASIDSDATGFQPEEGGAHPTAALKSSDLL